MIFLTGEGLRRLLATADRLGVRDGAVGGLARARKITRGPKPARALHEIGLASDIAAAVPTSAGVIAELAGLDLRGRTVGVQLYGEEPNRPLIEAIEKAGATARAVAPYVYASAADEAAVRGLIDALDAGRIDAIAFTSASQIDRLFAVAAGRRGRTAAAGRPGARPGRRDRPHRRRGAGQPRRARRRRPRKGVRDAPAGERAGRGAGPEVRASDSGCGPRGRIS